MMPDTTCQNKFFCPLNLPSFLGIGPVYLVVGSLPAAPVGMLANLEWTGRCGCSNELYWTIRGVCAMARTTTRRVGSGGGRLSSERSAANSSDVELMKCGSSQAVLEWLRCGWAWPMCGDTPSLLGTARRAKRKRSRSDLRVSDSLASCGHKRRLWVAEGVIRCQFSVVDELHENTKKGAASKRRFCASDAVFHLDLTPTL
jgi:hypothetical protein